MEAIQLNLQSPVYGLKELSIVDMTERNGELLIKLNGADCFDIYPNQKLVFKRYVYEDNDINFVLTDYVTVLSEDEKHVIHTTLLPTYRTTLYSGKNNIRYVSGTTETEDGTEEKYEYHIIKCREPHNIFPQDASTQEIHIKDYEGNELWSGNNITIPLKRTDWATVPFDCITELDDEETCGKNFKKVKYYKYDFLSEKISRDSIILNDVLDDYVIENMAYIETKFNPYYFYFYNVDENNDFVEFDAYDKPVKHCRLYGDAWWDAFNDSNSTTEKYINSGNTRAILGLNNAYWNANLGLSSPSNETTLGSEDTFSTSFVDDLEQSLIPDIIDMERVKYVPMIEEDEALTIATSITFNFHFRKREEITDRKRKNNTSASSGNVYYDGWYINPDSADTIWWNGMNYTGSGFSSSDFNSFLEKKAEVSDLLGYLNFTDNDIFYKKKKVSQSFVRLTFYNSDDPIEQKLLFHSTIFLDATSLYGKYVRQLLFMEENKLDTSEGNQNTKVVFCSANTASARLDTQIVVTNEFDRTKSAEGFNLYLFAEDTNFNVEENGEKTIYMKVEFNHAGNGKTLPMIMWPKSGNTYVPLTTSNFIKSLYIPIKLTYINGKYAYYIPNAYKNENGNISLVLFEPKLDFNENEERNN